MKVYLDLFIIFNFFIDFFLLISVSFILKRKSNLKRIIIGSLIGSIIPISLFFNMDKILLIIFIILTSLLMLIISFGYRDIRYTINNLFYFYITSILIGGFLYLLNIKIANVFIYYLVLIIISLLIISFYINQSLKTRNNYSNYYKTIIYLEDDKKIDLISFLDTGNNLIDPYRKRPIILINNNIIDIDSYKIILVPFKSLNNNGLLKCIKGNKIIINNKVINKKYLIGISEEKILIEGVECILNSKLMKGII